jgi:hypothetical protein
MARETEETERTATKGKEEEENKTKQNKKLLENTYNR